MKVLRLHIGGIYELMKGWTVEKMTRDRHEGAGLLFRYILCLDDKTTVYSKSW
jgi:hypothetical protein